MVALLPVCVVAESASAELCRQWLFPVGAGNGRNGFERKPDDAPVVGGGHHVICRR